MHRLLFLWFLSLTAILGVVAACGGEGGHAPWHYCDTQTSYSADWYGLDFRLEHDDPRLCPQEVDSGTVMTAGGRVYDDNTPDQGVATILSVYNSDTVLVATDYEEFGWDANQEWRTVNNMQYPAYTGGACFDDVRYDVVYFENLQQDTAWANLRIHYTSGFIC